MSPVMAIFLIVVVIVAIIGLIVLAGTIADRPQRLPSPQRTELKALRATLRNIELLCARNKDVNPELASQIEDEIYTYKTKEIS